MRPVNPAIPLSDDEARTKKVVMSVVALILVSVVCIMGLVIFVRSNPDIDATRGGLKSPCNSSKIIYTACARTLYPELCISTLVTYPGVHQLVEPKDVVPLTVKATMERARQSMALNIVWQEETERAAYEDCVELLHDTIYHLNASLVNMQAMSRKNPLSILSDVNTWLSAALTNQDTCLEGFQHLIIAAGGNVKSNITNEIKQESKKLSELISNSLAMFRTLFGNASLENSQQRNRMNRRILEKTGQVNNPGLDQEFYEDYGLIDQDGMKDFPLWLSPIDRLLLRLSPADLKADAIVAKDGSGDYLSIADAVNDAPSNLRGKKYIIYVKAGLYSETVRVSKRKINIMLVGEGKGKTVVVSNRNVKDGFTTFSSATFGTFPNLSVFIF
jgi:pectinesterase inhibitor-like protein